MAGVIGDTSERCLWPSVVESITLSSRVFGVHDALWSIFSKFLAVIAPGACSTHVRSRVSRHQTAIGAVACVCRSRRIRFARKRSSKCISSNVIGGFAMVK